MFPFCIVITHSIAYNKYQHPFDPWCGHQVRSSWFGEIRTRQTSNILNIRSNNGFGHIVLQLSGSRSTSSCSAFLFTRLWNATYVGESQQYILLPVDQEFKFLLIKSNFHLKYYIVLFLWFILHNLRKQGQAQIVRPMFSHNHTLLVTVLIDWPLCLRIYYEQRPVCRFVLRFIPTK